MQKSGENKITFQNHHKPLPAHYIIYADFEALATTICLSFTLCNTQQHVAIAMYAAIDMQRPQWNIEGPTW